MDIFSATETTQANGKFDLYELFHANINESSRLSLRLYDTKLNRPYLLNRELSHFTIIGSSLSNLSIMGSTLENGRFVDCSLTDPNLTCCVFKNNYFKKVFFQNCTVRHTVFENCTFDNCQFTFLMPITAEDNLRFENSLFIDFQPTNNGPSDYKEVFFQSCTFLGGTLPSTIRERPDNSILQPPTTEPLQKPPKPGPQSPESTDPPSSRETDRSQSQSRFEELEMELERGPQ